MVLFNRLIDHILIIDLLPDFQLTGALDGFFDGKISHLVLTPDTREEFFEFLAALATGSAGRGILLQLISHGNEERTLFGKDKSLAFEWSEIIKPFEKINRACENNFIVNASMTCFSDQLAHLKLAHPAIFHAAIYSVTTRSLQAVDQNINIYKQCLQRDSIIQAITSENDAVDAGFDGRLRPFGYIG